MISGSTYLLILLLAALEEGKTGSQNWARGIKRGDEKVFKAFFDTYYNMLFRFLTSRGVDEPVAKDLIQNAFLYIWDNREKIDEQKSLRSYLYTIAYSRMINHIKFQNRFEEGEPDEKKEVHLSPEDELQGKELKELVSHTISLMPPQRRAVFELCFIQEFTYKETADLMEISVNTVENHMTRAFKDVRSAVDKYYNKNENSE